MVTIEAMRGLWRQSDYGRRMHRLAQRRCRSPALFVGVDKQHEQIAARDSATMTPGVATLARRTGRGV